MSEFKFFYGRLLQMLGSFLIITIVSSLFGWLLGFGISLLLLGTILEWVYFEKIGD